ncbi:LysM peptidoglycan-binding domain-containing protein [Chryseobacterium oryctis]|uniref:LysM peptidoglycan-binding domain-containing protein n=1 Tax=Chryseobacterium oryctis TaxID=2952618 RepID=A0ABT3HRS0_9FLAO|nr:LysM peptidoglycan-binding domain-containing protein [Chryseobacterium oryctis]MCW3162489.1 LysM peptidoglycan-binding domain-containing protein [Chryseobacterium oryctis]
MTNHHIHTIQKGDTLQSVSKQYGISAEELRNYHNRYCELPDLLNREIEHQKELIVPKLGQEGNSEETPKEKERKKVSFAPNNKLSYSPVNTHYKYGVMIILENGEDKNELKYETSVKWLQKYGDFHIFEIDRTSKIYINKEEVNDIADLLAYETSKVLFPMHIVVDEDGNWEEVAKYNKYPERWKAIKSNLQKEFEGEMVENYFQKIEKILETPEQINFYMLGDFFLRTLFLGYCFNYGKDFTAEKHITFPIVENGIEPRYKIQAKVDPYLDEYNLINIELEGVLDDERSKEDFINERPFAFNNNYEKQKDIDNRSLGEIAIQGFLNPKSGIPEALHLECSIELDETKKITVVIANLSETGTLRAKSKETIVEGKATEKVGFWGRVKEYLKEMDNPEYFQEKHRNIMKQQMKK